MAQDYFANVLGAPPIVAPQAIPGGLALGTDPLQALQAQALPQAQGAQVQDPFASQVQGILQKLQQTPPEKRKAIAQVLQQQYPGGPQDTIPGVNAEIPEGAPLSKEAASKWDVFLDELTKPGAANFLLNLGARLMQPRPIGQTQGGAIGQAALGAVNNLAQQKAAQRKGQLEEALLGAKVGLIGAQKGQLEAETSLTGTKKERLEADTKRLLALAKKYGMEAAKEKMVAAGAKVPKELSLAEQMGKLLYQNYPDRFKDANEANLKALEFVVRKGKDPMTELLINYVKMAAGIAEPGDISAGLSGIKGAAREAGLGQLGGTPVQEREQAIADMEAASAQFTGEDPEDLKKKAERIPAARYRYYVDVMGLSPEQAWARIEKQMAYAQGGGK